MARNNPYYQQCLYLKTTFHDKGVSSYCTRFCLLWGHRIDFKGMKIMCCLSNSPYTEKNCKYFKDKTGLEQKSIMDYM